MSVTVLARASRFPLSEKIFLVLMLSSFALLSLAGCSSDHSFPGVYPTPAQTPAAPGAVTVTAGDGQIMLTWSPVSSATSYNIYWSNTSGVTSSNGTAMSGLTSTQYTHASLTNGLNYYYVVTAVNSAGESAASSQASAKPMPPI